MTWPTPAGFKIVTDTVAKVTNLCGFAPKYYIHVSPKIATGTLCK